MLRSFIIAAGSMVIAMTSYSQSSPGKFSLIGKCPAALKGMVYIVYSGVDDKTVKDSCRIQNGAFSFTGNIPEPVQSWLTLKQPGKKDVAETNLYLEPGLIKMVVPGNDFSKAVFSGSRTQAEEERKNAVLAKIALPYKFLLDSLSVEQDPDKSATLEQQLAPYYKKVDAYLFDYYLKHPSSYLTAFSLRLLLRRIPVDSVLLFYNNMTDAVKASRDGKIADREIQLLKTTSKGYAAPGFSRADINGHIVSLTNLKGQYVLLDFWASWCVPCRKGNPHLIALYNQYKSKGFEIIGVSDDDGNAGAWKKAVEQDNLPWLHVLRGIDWEKIRNDRRNENDIAENFGIHTLPTQVLIDRNGVIIGRYLDNDPELDIVLRQIFENK